MISKPAPSAALVDSFVMPRFGCGVTLPSEFVALRSDILLNALLSCNQLILKFVKSLFVCRLDIADNLKSLVVKFSRAEIVEVFL